MLLYTTSSSPEVRYRTWFKKNEFLLFKFIIWSSWFNFLVRFQNVLFARGLFFFHSVFVFVVSALLQQQKLDSVWRKVFLIFILFKLLSRTSFHPNFCQNLSFFLFLGNFWTTKSLQVGNRLKKKRLLHHKAASFVRFSTLVFLSLSTFSFYFPSRRLQRPTCFPLALFMLFFCYYYNFSPAAAHQLSAWEASQKKRPEDRLLEERKTDLVRRRVSFVWRMRGEKKKAASFIYFFSANVSPSFWLQRSDIDSSLSGKKRCAKIKLTREKASIFTDWANWIVRRALNDLHSKLSLMFITFHDSFMWKNKQQSHDWTLDYAWWAINCLFF